MQIGIEDNVLGFIPNQIGGSGNGEVVDGSGTGEMLEEVNDWPPECTSEFQKEKDDHTMCIYYDDKRVTNFGVSDTDKKIIVDLHNRLRGNVNPPATDLSKLVWDDKIAAVAQKWAKQCRTGHDKNRDVPSYGLAIGQNVVASSDYYDWEEIVMAWYNEVQLFKYGENPDDYLGEGGWIEIGHYTQVVQNTTYRIGCGYAECSSSSSYYRNFYVCNYGKGQYNIAKPYTEGERCSACPNSCKNGVCDCGGKMCLNGGKLDINRCTCTCGKIFRGASCETVNCPSFDDPQCWNPLSPKQCGFNWVRAACPFMCGVCGGPKGATPPPVFVSKHKCTYTGQRRSQAACSAYGDKGADTQSCETRGGRFGCSDCIKYNNVRTEYCPVMCGMCDGPCDGKNCKNGGTLNGVTCQCECPKPYTGLTCEKTHCPATLKDDYSCWKSFKPRDCAKFTNVPIECPWMCGVCGPEGATPPPVFISDFGCTYTGQRASKADCKTYGNKGADTWACASNGGKHNCDACTVFDNFKYDYCPVMCGICAPTPRPVFISDFGCTYTGQRASKAECKTYGDNGADTSACASNGGKHNCDACTVFDYFKYDYCPVMCGICAPQTQRARGDTDSYYTYN